jgi:hypothetical protein
MTREQVAHELGKSVRTIDYWRKNEGLPSSKVGHSVLIRWSAVTHFLDSRADDAGRNGEAVRTGGASGNGKIERIGKVGGKVTQTARG